MKKLYEEDAYLREFTSVVTGCAPAQEGYRITLEETAFYPEGGGQPADSGELGGVRVLDVHIADGEIVHYTDGPLRVGSRVTGKIDWERRFRLMQEHSGEHIVSGLIHQKYGYDNVGFHMGDEIRLDMSGELTWEQLEEIETLANRIIWQDVPLHIWIPAPDELSVMPYRSKKPLEGKVRIVEIPGADICACCGTHVKRTGEIGLIKFTSMIRYKGGVRIMMQAGQRALLDVQAKGRQNREICELLSAKPYEAAAAVRKKCEETQRLAARLSSLRGRLREIREEALPPADGLVILWEEGAEPAEIRRFCERILANGKAAICAVLSSEDDQANAFRYCIGSRQADMRAAVKTLNGRLSGRGGGSPEMVQGTFYAEKTEIRAVLEEILGD